MMPPVVPAFCVLCVLVLAAPAVGAQSMPGEAHSSPHTEPASRRAGVESSSRDGIDNPPIPETFRRITLRGTLRDCESVEGRVACTVVFTEGRSRRVVMEPDPGLVHGRTGTPAPPSLEGKEVVVDGDVDTRGELVRVHSIRLAE
jgi:hypothetical protein